MFTLQAVLLLVADIARSDLVIRPRWDLSSGLGAVFIAYALIGYPLVGVLGGHPLRTVPVFGVSPCATVTFFFGLLLWAVPPVPKYPLLVPLAWALSAAPPNMATGVEVDYGMLLGGDHGRADHLARPFRGTGLAHRGRRAAVRLVRP